MNAVTVDSNINADTAWSVGKKILSSMSGMLATDYPHKRSAQAVTLVSKSSVKIADDQVQVDLRLLFQRLIIVCDNSLLEELFQYELCTYPTALFDYPFMLRQPQKPALADALWTKPYTPEAKTQPKGNVQYVPRGSLTYKSARLVLHSLAKEIRKSNSGF